MHDWKLLKTKKEEDCERYEESQHSQKTSSGKKNKDKTRNIGKVIKCKASVQSMIKEDVLKRKLKVSGRYYRESNLS